MKGVLGVWRNAIEIATSCGTLSFMGAEPVLEIFSDYI